MLPLTRSRNRARFFGIPFSPSTLFQGGTVAGAWYDSSDPSTMFTTSDGTTPVAMPGLGAAVPVGLVLDKSQGLVLGANDITGFTPTILGTATAATYNSATGAGTATRVDSSNLSYLIKTGLTSNRVYRITVTNTGSSSLQIRQNGTTVGLFIVAAGATVTGLVTTYTYTDVSIVPITNGTTIAFTIVSFQQVSGNHAIAANDSTKRPVLMARVNLLTYSEDFSNAVWDLASPARVTITTNTTTDPIGGTTADTMTETTTTSTHRVLATYTHTTSIANQNWTLSAYYKIASGSPYAVLALTDANGTNQIIAWFDLANAQVGTVSNVGNGSGATASITPAGNGWYQCKLSGIASTAPAGSPSSMPVFVGMSSADNVTTYTGDTGRAVYIWGADLRPANIGANVPAYQRIADANTYDTSGFPLYLRFDGIDDSMYTPANLNLSGTDKVAVFAGVRKLANTPDGVIAELSAAVSANNGAFGLYAPSASGAATLRFASKGTISSVTDGPAGFTAPATAVVNAFGDISGDLANLRFDGSQSSSSTTDQGTGNFGTYPFYIGSRNNATAWFNGHLYSLAVVGSAVSAGNIAAMESWVAGRTGIQI